MDELVVGTYFYGKRDGKLKFVNGEGKIESERLESLKHYLKLKHCKNI